MWWCWSPLVGPWPQASHATTCQHTGLMSHRLMGLPGGPARSNLEALGRPRGLAGGGWSTCSFSVSWCEEAFHKLGVQDAEVSGLSCAFPLSSVSPASQQGLWFPELMQSASVSQLLLWILSKEYFLPALNVEHKPLLLLGKCYFPMWFIYFIFVVDFEHKFHECSLHTYHIFVSTFLLGILNTNA
jgi:hypothetical protein